MRKFSVVMLAVTAVLVATMAANEKAPAGFQQAMKDNGAAMMKIGKDAEAKDYDAIAAGAATLKKNFMGPIGKYWTDTKNDGAMTMCKDAYGAADTLEKAAKAKSDTGIADARKAMGASCGSCHTAHREKLADGSFEIK
jgi:cytochrome c556